MTRKKHNLLKDGLSSELFLLTMLRPDTIYGLGKRLQNVKKPSLSKIYRARDDLVFHQYIKQIDENYYINPKKIVLEIENLLKEKKQHLDNTEIELLKILFSNINFFGIFSFEVIDKLRKQPKHTHNLDALSIFSNFIGKFSTIILFKLLHDSEIKEYKKTVKNFSLDEIKAVLDEMDKILSKINKKIDSNISNVFKTLTPRQKSNVDLVYNLEDVRKSSKKLTSMLVLLFMKTSTLKKLCLLWDQHEGFAFGIKMASKYEKKQQIKFTKKDRL